MEVGSPKRFRGAALLTVSGYGLLVMLPLFFSILAISVMPFGPLTLALPLAAMAFATVFLPCGFGNPVVRRLVSALHPAGSGPEQGFIVQLSLRPRLRTGLRAVLEDADDVGWLRFTERELHFAGDAVQLRVPFEQMRELRCQNIGWRGLFLYGPRSTFKVSGLPQVEAVELAERSSSVLPGSRRRAKELFQRLAACQPKG